MNLKNNISTDVLCAQLPTDGYTFQASFNGVIIYRYDGFTVQCSDNDISFRQDMDFATLLLSQTLSVFEDDAIIYSHELDDTMACGVQEI